MPFIRSISGIRATVNDSLNKDIIQQYIRGFAQYLPQGSVVVGFDGRPSGTWIAEIVTQTLSECGRDVLYIGIAPTPTVQLLTEQTPDCAGGISISASHNPIEWNGLKFIGGDGVFLDAEQNSKFWKFVDSPDNNTGIAHHGTVTSLHNVMTYHIESITKNPLFSKAIDICKKRSLTVVVDAVNASGSRYIPALLKEFGCNVIELYCDATGKFPHIPEPLPEHLYELQNAVIQHNADLGIAVDPDADRLVLIDENGIAIGEERTITLCVLAALIMNPPNDKPENVVVNLSTTMAVNTVCKQHNANIVRSAVGEINVVRLMQSTDAIIGGEGSGGVILPASHYGRDSLVGTALILSLMTQINKSLSEINATIPTYSMKKTKVEFTGNFSSIKQQLRILFSPKEFREDDGLYCQFEDSWLHVRTSNTEPIARIIAESSSDEQTQSLIDKALTVFR
ncbi:MAG TPA: phosphoglucosamine mutase [Candidatus Kapabacteria bacterium]|nr:phosphoglucosamine mutase [Candidatus Kapabacteria bacterium]